MVGGVAFDQILRLLLRGMDRVSLERNGRDDFFLDRSLNTTGFRVPSHMISNFKVLLHWYGLLLAFMVHLFLVGLLKDLPEKVPQRRILIDNRSRRTFEACHDLS